jgi:hypothetical protein
MDKTHFLLRSLSPPQLKMLKDYLHYFSVRKDPETQLLKLADIIIQSGDEVPSLEDCSRMIYGTMNYNGIQKLKSRLRKKIENLLLLDTGTEKRDKGLDELDKYIILVRRKVTLFHVLLLSKTDSSRFLDAEMEEIIRISKKYELYSILIEQLKYKKWMVGLKEGEKEMNALSTDIKFYQKCEETLNKAVDCYYKAVIRTSHNTKSDRLGLQRFLKQSIRELGNENEAMGSAVVTYYSKQLEAMYYDSLHKISYSRQAAMEMLYIIKNNKSVFRKQRLAIAYIYLSNCDIRAGEYENAIQNASSARKYCLKNSVNYYGSVDYEFLARFYLSDLTGSQRLSHELLRSVKKEVGDFFFAKYLFYQASVYFALGRYKDTLRQLNFKMQLSKDKQGWDMSIRILKIQTTVEMSNLDDASAQVAALIKHAERAFLNGTLKPREKLILRTLRMLEHDGFSGLRIRQKLFKSYELLRNNVNYCWEPLSSELIPFESWLASHYNLGKTRRKD